MTDLPLSALQCGPHLPIDEAAKEALLARGESPTAIHNNCSGKHAGMLLMCRHAGYPIESYLEPEHPLQQQILTGLCQWTELTGIPTAIDGCGAPVFYLPLTAIARLYAQLVRHELFAPIVQVMTAYPHLVGGQGRVDTTLMQVSAGRLLAKVGADGLIAVAHREREQGLALKMASGSNEYRNLYIVWALAQMGWLTAEELASPLLQPFQVLDITNTQGRIVGAHQFFLPLVS
jgi:L-asparaginase II